MVLLGGGLLLLGSALVLALAPRPLTEARRAVAAVPLLTLAVLPSTINRPPGVYVHGLLLFGLLALFVWGERLDQDDGAVVIGVAAIAAAAGMAFAPALDSHKPWINYQALTSSLAPGASESFDWSQRYGPLAWPRKGHEVIDIKAAHQDYWKAQNLDVFNGRGWVAGEAAGGDQLVGVDQDSIQEWTQTITVTLRAMKTNNVIAAGYASQPTHIASGVSTGVSPGTWTTDTQLGPGDSYQVSVDDPHPTSGQLETAGEDYPGHADRLPGDVPPRDRRRHRVAFPAFGSHGRLQTFGRATADSPSASFSSAHPTVAHMPLSSAWLAGQRRPTTSSRLVKSYLSHGFSYNENTPVHQVIRWRGFLFTDKYGYCQQFAGAMAMLLRMGGVPARVSVGFTNGPTNQRLTTTWSQTSTPTPGSRRGSRTTAGSASIRRRRSRRLAAASSPIFSAAPNLKPGAGSPSVRGLGSGPTGPGDGRQEPRRHLAAGLDHPAGVAGRRRRGAAGADADHRRALRRRDVVRARTGACPQRENHRRRA